MHMYAPIYVNTYTGLQQMDTTLWAERRSKEGGPRVRASTAKQRQQGEQQAMKSCKKTRGGGRQPESKAATREGGPGVQGCLAPQRRRRQARAFSLCKIMERRC